MSADERYLQCRDCATKHPIETTTRGPCDLCGGALELREGERGHLIPEDVVDACDVVVRTYYGDSQLAPDRDEEERRVLGALREALDFNLAGEIPDRLLAACVDALEEEYRGNPQPELGFEHAARTVLEQLGRMLRPDAGEAVSLALGVARLDQRKLTAAGDTLARDARLRAGGQEELDLEPSLRGWARAAELYGYRG